MELEKRPENEAKHSKIIYAVEKVFKLTSVSWWHMDAYGRTANACHLLMVGSI